MNENRDIQVDEQAYRHFRKDLDSAKTLLYLTDNAGEIGFDQIFAEELQKAYPGLQITFCVRGGIAANDATRAASAAPVSFRPRSIWDRAKALEVSFSWA